MIAGLQMAEIAADIEGGSSLPRDKISSLKNKLNPWFSSWQTITYLSPIIDFKIIKKLPCLKTTQRNVSTQTQGCSTGIGMALGIWVVQAPLGSGWRLEWLKEQGKTNKPQRHNTPPGTDSILQPLQKSPGLFDIPFSSLNLETCKQGELGQQLWAEGRSCRGKWEGSWPGLAVSEGRALCCWLLHIKQNIQPLDNIWLYTFGNFLTWHMVTLLCQSSFACCQGFIAIPESCPASLDDLTPGICCAHVVLSLQNKEDTLKSHRRKPKTCNPKGYKPRKKAKIAQCLFLG